MSRRKNSTKKQAERIGSSSAGWFALPLDVILCAGLLVVLTAIVYLPSINGKFILDDDKLLTENPLIKASDGLYKFWLNTYKARVRD